MNKSLYILMIVVLGPLLLSACMGTFYGLKREQWMALSAAEQEQVKKEYAKVVARKNDLAYPDEREQQTKRFTSRAVDPDPPTIAK